MNYSRFGASCELESAQAVAHLHGHTETAVWRLCLRKKKVDLRTLGKVLKCVIIHERAINVCILYVLIMYLNYVLSC